jgi:hypothetical protein
MTRIVPQEDLLKFQKGECTIRSLLSLVSPIMDLRCIMSTLCSKGIRSTQSSSSLLRFPECCKGGASVGGSGAGSGGRVSIKAGAVSSSLGVSAAGGIVIDTSTANLRGQIPGQYIGSSASQRSIRSRASDGIHRKQHDMFFLHSENVVRRISRDATRDRICLDFGDQGRGADLHTDTHA